MFIYGSFWMKSPQVFLFPSSIRTWEKISGIFLKSFKSATFLLLLEWWHDGYSYRRRLKLDLLKIILYCLNGYPLLWHYPFLSQNFSKHRKVFSSCGNSKWMKRESKMIEGIPVDDWFIVLKYFFLPGYWFCCFLTCFLVVLYSLSYGSIPGAKCECTSSKCQQWKLVSKWGKITRGISEAWDKGRKHISTALTEQQVLF